MIVTARPVRDIDTDSFTDLTPVAVTGLEWGGDGSAEVTFASDLTAAEQAAVQRRMMSRNANEEELRRLAEVAMVNNRADIAINDTWLANNPGAAAVTRALVEQSTRQARQLNGVIRQLLGLLDGTD
jgi:hypothetical protein